MVAWLQARGLSQRGHKVLLVAPVGSKPPDEVELHGTTLGEPESQAYSGYIHRLPEHDAIIDNSWEKWSYILKIDGKLNAPILGVLHAPAETMYKTPPPIVHPCLVAISKDQSVAAMECLGVPARVAYDGVDIDFYNSQQRWTRNDRYLFLARMSRIKGPQIAVDIARKLRIGLDLVGDDKITGEPQLAQRMLAQAKNNITYHGGVSRDKAVEFFSTRKALLHMNLLFREPFGLAPVEAQLCFPANTLVKATDIGDLYEGTYTGDLIQIYNDGEPIECTPEHPFLTQRGWVAAKNLTTDDLLIRKSNYDQMDSERIGDLTERLSKQWAKNDGQDLGSDTITSSEQSQENETSSRSLPTMDRSRGADVEVHLPQRGCTWCTKAVTASNIENDQSACGADGCVMQLLREEVHERRNKNLKFRISEIGLGQNGQAVAKSYVLVDSMQSKEIVLVKNIQRQIRNASSYNDKVRIGLSGWIHRRRWDGHSQIVREKESETISIFVQHVRDADELVQREGPKLDSYMGKENYHQKTAPVLEAGNLRAKTLSAIQSVAALSCVEKATDGNNARMGETEIEQEPIRKDYSEAAIARAHDGFYEFKAITNIRRRKVENLRVYNLGTSTGTYEVAGVIVHNCGMPVIAFDNGAMRETVKHGETGFIVKTQEEVEELIKTDAVASINSNKCREWASQFSVKAMIDTYETLIGEAVDTGGW
jgi:glycosyltransferase involved in cell wall biosynthesis